MNKAIGLMELSSVAKGILVLDTLVKTAKIEILKAEVVNPGKYVILFAGQHSAVKAALEKGLVDFGSQIIDYGFLGNPHSQVLEALQQKKNSKAQGAIGIIETSSIISSIACADTAIKTAVVEMIEMKVAVEMGGKGCVLFTGDLGAVEAALEAAVAYAYRQGTYIESSLLPNPDEEVWKTF